MTITLYEKESGKPKDFAHIIDAKESMMSGFYVQEKPAKKDSKSKPKVEPKTAPKKVVKEPEKVEEKPKPIRKSDSEKKSLSVPTYNKDDDSKLIRK